MLNRKFIKYYTSSILLVFSTILYFVILFIGNYYEDLKSISSVFGVIFVFGCLIPIFLSPILVLIQFIQLLYFLYKRYWSISIHHFANMLITLIIYILHMKYTKIGLIAQQ